MIEGAQKALRQKMSEHAELEYRRTGKPFTGDQHLEYLRKLEKLSDMTGFEALLEQITTDAEQA